MTNDRPAKPTHATVWREFRAGDAVGRPMAEWAYVTPNYPEGITGSQLRESSAETQAETARFWFFQNFEPYHLRPGTYFGFDSGEREPASEPAGFAPELDTTFGGAMNSAPLGAEPLGGAPTAGGFGTGGFGVGPFGGGRPSEPSSGVRIGGFGHPFAPSPLKAGDMLRLQFGENLSEEVLMQLGDELGNDWIERHPDDPILGRATGTDLSQADPQTIIAIVSDLMRSQLEVLSALPPNYRHNEVGGRTFVALDTEAFKLLLDRVNVAAKTGGQAGADELAATSAPIQELGTQAGKEAQRLSELYIKALVDGAGKETAKLIADGIRALGLLFLGSALLSQAIALVSRAFGH